MNSETKRLKRKEGEENRKIVYFKIHLIMNEKKIEEILSNTCNKWARVNGSIYTLHRSWSCSVLKIYLFEKKQL